MILTCDWSHPGQDRYTGTAAAAIHAYAQIPRATQDKLIAKFERREFDDFVTIWRDSITGDSGKYSPTIRGMHFGANPADICGQVDRSGWAANHVESALVVCADGYCVASPTVCSNWFILEREQTEEKPAAALPPPAVEAPIAMSTQESIMPIVEDSPPLIEPEAPTLSGETPPWIPIGTDATFTFVPIPTPPVPLPPTPVSPVPEPATWDTLLAGFLLILRRVRRG